MKIIFSPFNSSMFNLAAEEYYFSSFQDELLFLYVNEPSVIIGSNQVVENEVNIDFCNQHDIKIIRRKSGGGAVYHDLGNLNYSFITNQIGINSFSDNSFLFTIIEILQNLKIPVEIGKRNDLWLPDQYKISGTASHISKKRKLLHGTLLFDSNLEDLIKSLTVSTKNSNLNGTVSVPSQVKNMKEFLHENGIELDMNNFILLFKKEVEKHFNTTSQIAIETYEIGEIIEKTYSRRDWNFRK